MPQPFTSRPNPGKRKTSSQRVVRTNTRCKECSKELEKKEGEVCDECRLTKLGWRKG